MIEIDSTFRKPLELAFNGALQYLEKLDRAPVNGGADWLTLQKRLAKELQAQGLAPDRVIEELLEDVEGGIIGSAGGRFYAWVIGGALPAALAADWLTSAWDQNAAQAQSAPAAAVVEEVAGTWLKDLFGLPDGASFALVTGCQMAHATCLASARHALLSQCGWNVEQRGLYGAPPIRVITGEHYHGSVDRAVKLLGMGLANIVRLRTSEDGKLARDELLRALHESDSPAIVILQAGDINAGTFDDFASLIPLAKERGAWVHVDGAFGLWAAANPHYRHLLEGSDLADSWASDGHKWLNVPYDSGYAFIRDTESHRAAMFQPLPYIPIVEDVRDPHVWSPEWSRRARGFATYAALRELGRDGVAALVERCCAQAHAIVMGIAQLDGAELLWEPSLNQGLVRFLDPRPDATSADHDRRTNEVIAAVVASGEAFFSGTTWRGQRAMRVSVCNWQTSERDVERAIHAVANCNGSLGRNGS